MTALSDEWRRPTKDMLIGLECFTLWRPWPTYIVHPDMPDPKRVENRGWHFPRRLRGAVVGIHAGGTLDHAVRSAEGRHYCQGEPSEALIAHSERKFALVGVAVLDTSVESCPEGQARWYNEGSVGWVLAEVVPFDEPVPIKGAQGFWRVTEELLERGDRPRPRLRQAEAQASLFPPKPENNC